MYLRRSGELHTVKEDINLTKKRKNEIKSRGVIFGRIRLGVKNLLLFGEELLFSI
jgi:hypothetical protein